MAYQSKDFKWRHFQGDVILQCVRWYCKYGISYRDLEEMMNKCGVIVDHTTLYRWVQRYAPELKRNGSQIATVVVGFSMRPTLRLKGNGSIFIEQLMSTVKR